MSGFIKESKQTSLESVSWKLYVTANEAPAALDTPVTVTVFEINPVTYATSAVSGKVNASQPDHGVNYVSTPYIENLEAGKRYLIRPRYVNGAGSTVEKAFTLEVPL